MTEIRVACVQNTAGRDIHANVERVCAQIDEAVAGGADFVALPETVGLIEAPRGTLFHHYEVNENDQVTRCNLIVSTTNNNVPMNRAVEKVARDFLTGAEITEGLLNRVEVAIRAYDGSRAGPRDARTTVVVRSPRASEGMAWARR